MISQRFAISMNGNDPEKMQTGRKKNDGEKKRCMHCTVEH